MSRAERGKDGGNHFPVHGVQCTAPALDDGDLGRPAHPCTLDGGGITPGPPVRPESGRTRLFRPPTRPDGAGNPSAPPTHSTLEGVRGREGEDCCPAHPAHPAHQER